MYVREFERAILDPKLDPDAKHRLNSAIALQRQFTIPPEVRAEQEAQAAQQQPELPPEATVAEALSGQFALPAGQ